MSELISQAQVAKRYRKRADWVKATLGHLALPCPEGSGRLVFSTVTVDAYFRRLGELAAERTAA